MNATGKRARASIGGNRYTVHKAQHHRKQITKRFADEKMGPAAYQAKKAAHRKALNDAE